MLKIKIDENYSDISFKNFLKKRLDISSGRLWRLIRQEKILINNIPVKNSYFLKNGDEIKILEENIKLKERFDFKKSKINKENKENKISLKDMIKNLNIETIFENDDFFVLNKNANIVVQTEMDNENSLLYHLNYLKKKNNDETNFIYTPVHRLDKDTSGIIIIAKNPLTLRKFNEIFKDKKVIKKYKCLCFGEFEKEENLIEVYLEKTNGFNKEKKKVLISSKKNEKAKLSKTKYRVLEKLEFENENFSLVEINLLTGITHQIRIVMSSLGNPIICDKMYGVDFINEKFFNRKILNRQFLHASYISFSIFGKDYEFKADYTNDLKKCLKILK